jgi:parallel beta-helix repeat protein
MHKSIITKFILIITALNTLQTTKAGDLNPPPGPITPTMKPLTEIEPRIAINATNTPGDDDSLFKITESGSYYLTGNIIGESGKVGVEIAASGITLDLMGFDLVGVVGSLDGIIAEPAENIAVRNGSLRDWGDDGVDLSSAAGTRLADLRASGNARVGIRAGNNAVVTGCISRSNVKGGITTGNNSMITNCSAESNQGNPSVPGNGFATGNNCTITNCSAQSNGGAGITTGPGSSITNCSARSNTLNGIFADGSCAVTNCSATFNALNGISGASSSTITDCVASFNVQDGIRVAANCTVRGNTCDTNGNGGVGAGVNATSNRNRIEGNTVLNSDVGILVANGVLGNIVISNYASGNTAHFQHPASNNYIGTVVVTGSATMNSAANSLINIAF